MAAKSPDSIQTGITTGQTQETTDQSSVLPTASGQDSLTLEQIAALIAGNLGAVAIQKFGLVPTI